MLYFFYLVAGFDYIQANWFLLEARRVKNEMCLLYKYWTNRLKRHWACVHNPRMNSRHFQPLTRMQKIFMSTFHVRLCSLWNFVVEYFATGSLCAWIRRDETSIIHLVSVAQCWSYTNITWIFKLFHWNNIYFVKQKINNLFECSSIEQNLVIVTDIL